MRSPKEIVATFAERKKAWAPVMAKRMELRDAYNGDTAVPLPELDKNEQSAVANLIALGLDQIAMRVASTSTDIYSPALKPGQELSEKKARTRRQAAFGWMEENELPLKNYRRARRLIGYAASPVIIQPDPTRQIPQWYFADPLATFPAPMDDPDDMCPTDCIVSFQRSLGWLKQRYPNEIARLKKGSSPKPDDKYDVIRYVDHEQLAMIVVGRSDSSWQPTGGEDEVLLEWIPNRSGMCLAVVPQRITLDRPVGQFDQMIGLYRQQAMLMALEVIAVKKGVLPTTVIESFPNAPGQPELITGDTIHPGWSGLVNIIKNGTVRELVSNPGYQTFPTIDRLERAQRLSGGVPQEFGGECVDEQTEILTDDGWRRYDRVEVGDLVLTLNHESGLAEWQQIEKMNLFDAEPRRMVEMEGPRHSSLTTTNHRWPIVNMGNRGWKFSADLTTVDQVPIAAMNAEVPTDRKYSDALVEAVAWYYTEGSNRGSGGQISQSIKKPENVDRIRACLSTLFGPATSGWRYLSGCGQGGVGHDGVPRWSEPAPSSTGVIKWALSRHAVDYLEAHAPDKVPHTGFLHSLTQSQLELFIRVSMLADNCGENRFGQKDPARAEAFAFACILAGKAVSYQHRVKTEARPGWRAGEYEAFIVRERKRRFVKPKENAQKGSSTFREVNHTGIVWCPTTANGTWYARRRGTCYFTGNSTSNIRTGRRGDSVISATVDFTIQEDQRVLASSQNHEFERAIEVTKAWFGNDRKSFWVGYKGAQGQVDYVPNEIFETGSRLISSYSHAGSDVNGLNIAIGQLIGTGMLSLTTGRELHPMIEDPEKEHDRTTAEALERAMLSSIEQRAAMPVEQGGLHPTDVAKITRAVLTNRKDVATAVLEVDEERSKIQSTTEQPALPGTPEAMPGLAPGGEAGTEVMPNVGDLGSLLMKLRGPTMTVPSERNVNVA